MNLPFGAEFLLLILIKVNIHDIINKLIALHTNLQYKLSRP